jgi:putative PIN family toxin of toxin-antitoxin system
MLRVVLDSTVLVSAFLVKNGISATLLRHAADGAFALYLADEILEETGTVLLERSHIRTRYEYTDKSVEAFVLGLRAAAHRVTDLPKLAGIVRDPNDDVVVACAVNASAGYVITRDKDLLTLGSYQATTFVTPEDFLKALRRA